jgi:hypothetical protein
MKKPRWITAQNGTRHFFYHYNHSGDGGLSACGHWLTLLTKTNWYRYLGFQVIDAEKKKHCGTCVNTVTKWAAQGALAALDG